MENLYKSESVKKFCKEPENPSYKNTKIPLHSRVLICGGSGSGKTNCLLNYIVKSEKTFDHILICNSNVEEPMYQALEEKLGKKGLITFFTLETLPTIQELKKKIGEKEEYLVVFDDIIGDLDNNRRMLQKLTNYAIMGRKINLTQAWLMQSFFKTPKTIRNQFTHLMLLRLASVRDLQIILSDYVLGVEKHQLFDMYKAATSQQFNCLRIDIFATDPNEKFARNFTDPFYLDDEPDGSVTVTPGPWFKPQLFSSAVHKRKRGE